MEKLLGKVAVISGASKGIGEGIARVFCKYGAKCVLLARGKEVIDLSRELNEMGYDTLGVRADVSDMNSLKEAVKKAVEKYAKIDILVNNAGIGAVDDFVNDTSFDMRDKILDIDIKGVWNTSKAFVPYIIEAGGGAIVNTSSVTGYMVADPGELAYCTAKSAIIGFTRGLARDLVGYKIRVNAICPGYVDTPMVRGAAEASMPENPQAVIDAIADAVPMKRLAEPEEIGELAAFLASDEASYITGTQVVIDGGSTLPETSVMGNR